MFVGMPLALVVLRLVLVGWWTFCMSLSVSGLAAPERVGVAIFNCYLHGEVEGSEERYT